MPGTLEYKAIRYYLRHWNALTRFVDDPAVPIDNNLAERLLKAVAQSSLAGRLLGEARGGQVASGAEADDAWDVFGSGAAGSLVTSAELDAFDFDAFADVEGADAFGAVDLVGGEGEEVGVGEGEFEEGLDGVAVEEDSIVPT